MPNLPTPQMEDGVEGVGGQVRPLDDVALHVARLELRSGIRPATEEGIKRAGSGSDARDMPGPLKVRMTTDEAIEFADEWAKCATFYEGAMGWRVVCKLLADEVRRLRRGEFICKRCSLRKDDEHPKADF